MSPKSGTSFVDHVRIRVRGGGGGRGSASFHRAKYVPKGSPDGGDGGHGGSVVLVTEPSTASLSAYVRRRSHRAASGGDGGANNRRGADGSDVILPVPVGTVIRRTATGEVLADLARPDVSFVAARGGRGGRGNASLRSAADRVPNYAEAGEPGQDEEIDLELHLVADVGFVGPPNAGKSTLLASLTRAQPKIADYPFTTIDPGLGVMVSDEGPITVADLPGLIGGASQGKGLGLRFLRHATRCAVLTLVVDLAAGDAVADLDAVAGEVEAYSSDLAARMRVVCGNKTDLAGADTAGASAWARERGLTFVAVSAKTGSNLDDLGRRLVEEVRTAERAGRRPETFMVFRPVAEDRVVVTREGRAFRVASDRAERLVSQTPMANPRAVRGLQRKLRALGVENALRRQGAREGDEVRIGEFVFEWFPEDGDGGVVGRA